jgi:hypothetical protein
MIILKFMLKKWDDIVWIGFNCLRIGFVGELSLTEYVKYIVLMGKVRMSLCLTKHHAMKRIWEGRYSSTHS